MEPVSALSNTAYCQPHRERSLTVLAVKIVAGTPMCDACFAGLPVGALDELDEPDEFFEMLQQTARVRASRKAYGIRAPASAEQIRRRRERVRTIRPRTSWRRGKRELKLPTARVSTARLSISSRQSEILSLLATGLSNGEIANALGLAERTVKFHLSSLYKKSATNGNRTNLVLWHLRRAGSLAAEHSIVEMTPAAISPDARLSA